MLGGVAGGSSLWIWSVIDVKGTYLGVVGWIPLVPKTLQSLEIVIGASHQELQCHLHNPDIEYRIVIACYDCGDLNNSDKYDKPWIMLNY